MCRIRAPIVKMRLAETRSGRFFAQGVCIRWIGTDLRTHGAGWSDPQRKMDREVGMRKCFGGILIALALLAGLALASAHVQTTANTCCTN